MTVEVQVVGTKTTIATPGSIAATIGATVAGNFLLCIVMAIGSGGPTISTPAGFSLAFTTGVPTIKHSVFIQSNIAAGITTVTSNLTNTDGAVMFVVELSAVPKSVLKWLATAGGSGTGGAYGSIATNAPTLSMYLERWYVAYGHNTAQAQSTSPAAAFAQIGGTQISTTGASTIEGRLYSADISSETWAIPAATLAGITDNTSSLTRLVGDQSATGGIGPYGANVMSGYSGAGGAGPG